MSKLEPWTFFTSFYWSFITMTTVKYLRFLLILSHEDNLPLPMCMSEYYKKITFDFAL